MRSSLAERVCISILPRGVEEFKQLSQQAVELGARLIELRLDGLRENEVVEAAKLLNGLDARKIVTLRPSWEGGHYEGDEKRRLELIGRVAAWADFVDLERDIVDSNPALVDELRGMGVRVISSRHFVGGSPIGSELRRIVSEGLKAVDIVKVVNSPGALSEAVEMLALYSEASFRDRLVSFSMGERWCLTRVFSVLLGAPFTYASLPGQPVAPGQLSFPEVVKALEVLSKTWHS